MNRFMRIVVGFWLLVGIAAAQELPDVSYPDIAVLTPAEVLRVLDGDSVELRFNGDEVKCDLIGVDAPERSNPPELFGKQAHAFLNNMLAGERVWIAVDPEIPAYDEANRAHVYLFRQPEKTYVNLEIIRQGYGNVDASKPFGDRELYITYGKAAQNMKRGVWGARLEQNRAIVQARARAASKPAQETTAAPTQGSSPGIIESFLDIFKTEPARTSATRSGAPKQMGSFYGRDGGVHGQRAGEPSLSPSKEKPARSSIRTPAAARPPSDSAAAAMIRSKCAIEWPDDFAMRKYCEDRQYKSLRELRDRRMTGILAKIRAKCASEWPDDFAMRDYCEKRQLKALQELNQ